MIVFIFGQPCSGKTTLARKLQKNSSKSTVIDGDELRAIFKDRDFSTDGRRANMLRAMNIALYENHRTESVFCSLLCPFNDQRLWLDDQAKVLWVYLTYDGDRGRESFHYSGFEQPENLKNYLHIHTSDLSEDAASTMIQEKINELSQNNNS